MADIVPQNCIWPVQRRTFGLARASGPARLESALTRFLRTRRGTLLCDPDYGSKVEDQRTQGMTEGKLEAIKVDISQGIARYIPDMLIRTVSMRAGAGPAERQTFKLKVDWSTKQRLLPLADQDTRQQSRATTVVI